MRSLKTNEHEIIYDNGYGREFPVIVEVDASNQVIDVDCQYAPSYLCDWPLDEFQSMYDDQYPENESLLAHDLEQDC